MIKITEGCPGDGMRYKTIEAILNAFRFCYRLTPAQAQTVLNAVLGQETATLKE